MAPTQDATEQKTQKQRKKLVCQRPAVVATVENLGKKGKANNSSSDPLKAQTQKPQFYPFPIHRFPGSFAGNTASFLPPLRMATLSDVGMSFCLPKVSLTNSAIGGHALVSMVITPTYNPHYASCKVNNGQMTTLMNKIMMKHYEKNKVAEDFLQEIERKIFSLEIHFSKCFQTAIKLQLYGSMLNGFGTTNCDVDLSLVFAEGAPFWATSSDVVMRFVSKCLVDLPNVIDARYISAKVPIVRFRFQDSDIDIDISYNNMLALHNSYLLKQYTYWDQRRIPILGVFIKKWAKINHIGDASQGSLSSYAWIIMLLYYLQTLRPFGLIPILQESQSGTGPRMVHGWNVAYSLYVDPSHCSKLNGSVYDLFLGFLHFYANQFNFADLMVQVAYRRIQPKPFNWKKFAMAIEDPFEKTHNLAQGISEQMLTHIRSCMLNTISVFTNAEHISTFCSANDVNLMFIEESFNLNEELLGKLGEHLLSLCILPNPPPATRRHRHRSTSLANSLSNSTDNSSILV